MSASYLLAVEARASDLSSTTSTPQARREDSSLLGEKQNIRKTFVRHVVKTVLADFPGRRFCELSILELGAGAGFFAESYAEVYSDDSPLDHFVQTDFDPHADGIVTLDVRELPSPDDLAEILGDRGLFDVVLSIDFLSCLSFGAGLDPEDDDDVDALGGFNEGLRNVLKADGAFYDFMASMPNSQFVMRFVRAASHAPQTLQRARHNAVRGR